MGSSIAGQASSAATNAQNQANTSFAAAMPIYQQIARGTTGLTPQQIQSMTNASGQTLAGTLSAAQGQAQLAAARNNNAGGFAAALDDAAQNAGAQQSQNVMGVQNENAQIEQQNRQLGLQGLSGFYSTGSNAGTSYLNTANSADQNALWKQILLQGMAGGASAGSAFLGRPH